MTRRILVVDDDRLMVKTLAEILQLQGWEARTAFDGGEALRAVQAEAFDVVLMDIRMPGMNGVEAFKAMKDARPDVKVVLMTAYAAQELIAEAEGEGALQVLSKPVNIPSLLALLTRTLERRRPVLIVDTDADFLHTLSGVLALKGWDTVVARDLGQAVRLMQRQHPAAILLHMHLGTTSAREAVLAVHEISPDVALILYSGLPHAEDEIDGHVPRALVHAFLRKPIAVDRITGVLNALARQ